ncbi:MAG: hypothetical protein ABSF77_05920 [Spirochaetia bacterium]|jgi:hypothetical protein
MGLLRKAAVAASRGDTDLLAPPIPPEETRPSGPGLLKRSIELLVSETPPPLNVELASAPQEPAAPSAVAAPLPTPSSERLQTSEEIVQGILAAIGSLRAGVELPSQLFSALASRLAIQKGAFLLYDPVRLVYAPWASLGYDQTTLHRLRIPLGANETWNALANGSPLAVTGAPALAAYQQFFSSREGSSLSRILLTPFIAEEKLIAVLLLSELGSPFATEEELLQCLARIAEAGSPRVHAARAIQLSSAGAVGMKPEASFSDESSRFLASFSPSSSSVLLISLSVEEYARTVIASHEHLDPFRLHEDMRYFLGSFLADIGKAMPARRGLFIVGLPDFDRSDLDLFLHQLSLFLHGLFSGNGRSGSAASPRIVKTLSWPADGSDMRGLLDSLSS